MPFLSAVYSDYVIFWAWTRLNLIVSIIPFGPRLSMAVCSKPFFNRFVLGV
jgi:hypothetical protein